jgi:hypothetical protein
VSLFENKLEANVDYTIAIPSASCANIELITAGENFPSLSNFKKLLFVSLLTSLYFVL